MKIYGSILKKQQLKYNLNKRKAQSGLPPGEEAV